MPRVCVCDEAYSHKAEFWFCPEHGPQHRSQEDSKVSREPSRERLERLRDRRIR